MTGAIPILQDLRRICAARFNCVGCPVSAFCNRNRKIREATNDDFCHLVRSISHEAECCENMMFLTRYEEVHKFHPAEGGIWLTGFVPDGKFSQKLHPCDVAGVLTCEAEGWCHAFGMSDEDIAFRNRYETRWEKDGRTVTLVYPDPSRDVVDNFIDCGDSEDGEYHESYHAYLSISVKDNDHIDGSYFVKYIPESMPRLHERPPIYS
ncbi:MAG: hypothetical protein IKZ82_06045 [Clostridia bacterium]|nr:hypothetical protein [Clostridia bacterium]